MWFVPFRTKPSIFALASSICFMELVKSSNVVAEAEERVSYQMPTFWKGRNIIHFAAAKKHIGIYPGGEATSVFADRLTQFKTSKGAIQLPYDAELPLELIAEMARWNYERNAKE